MSVGVLAAASRVLTPVVVIALSTYLMSRVSHGRPAGVSRRAFHGLVAALAVIVVFTARSLYLVGSSPDLENMTRAGMRELVFPVWQYGVPSASLAFVLGAFGSFLIAALRTPGPWRWLGVTVVAIASLLLTILLGLESKQLIRILVSLPILTFFGGLVFGPMILVGTVAHALWRQARAEPRVVRKAAVHGAVAAAIAIVLFTGDTLYQIATSERSTAILGVLAIPTTGLALAVILFGIVWMLSVLTMSLRGYLLRRTAG